MTQDEFNQLLQQEGLDNLGLFYLCRKAIRAVLMSKSYNIGGQTVTREDLDKLRKAEQYYGAACGEVKPAGRIMSQIRYQDNW